MSVLRDSVAESLLQALKIILKTGKISQKVHIFMLK